MNISQSATISKISLTNNQKIRTVYMK